MADTPKALKIGMVLDDGLDKPDGVQQYVLSIGGWLTDQGHEVHYLVGQTERTDITNLHSLARNVKVSFNGNRLSIPLPTSRRKLKRLLQAENFDVLHVQTPHSPFMGQRLVMLALPSTAIIGSFHILPYGRLAKWGNKALGWWLRPSLARFDKIVSVSPAAAGFARSSFGIATDVLPNVIDYRRFHLAQPLRKEAGSSILFLGRLVPRKGCELLLRAVAQIVREDGLTDLHVTIGGKGPLKPHLVKLVHRVGLQDIVEFAGFIGEAEKPGFYASADISVFPSSGGESFGIVLLEAMASGRSAVLAGDNPGYRSVMSPQPDLLFDPFNVQDLADKLRKYLGDPKLRLSQATWGSEYTKNFDVNHVGKKLEEIYAEALRKRRQL